MPQKLHNFERVEAALENIRVLLHMSTNERLTGKNRCDRLRQSQLTGEVQVLVATTAIRTVHYVLDHMAQTLHRRESLWFALGGP